MRPAICPSSDALRSKCSGHPDRRSIAHMAMTDDLVSIRGAPLFPVKSTQMTLFGLMRGMVRRAHIGLLKRPRLKSAVASVLGSKRLNQARRLVQRLSTIQKIALSTDFNLLLHELRSHELRAMPPCAQTVLSAGCSGRWYFDWISVNYGPIRRHIGLEYYTPKPDDLPPEVEWIANTVGDMAGVADGEVDLLFSGQNIEHLWPEEVAGFLLEAHRVLRPGGTLVVESPNRKVTAAQGWSHPEHVVEFTPAEIRDLLRLAGFEASDVRGLWLCFDARTGSVLPFDEIKADGAWPCLRRVAYGRSNPDDSFAWWAEATRTDRVPDARALRQAVMDIYRVAWPERITRLKSMVGEPGTLNERASVVARRRSEGALILGPYMPLRPGAYRFRFALAIDGDGLSGNTKIGRCEVLLSNGDRVAVAKQLTAAEFGATGPSNVALEFRLDRLEFGVQFRLITTGKAKVEAIFAVTLDEEVA
jgi:hypothetical protein